VGAVGTIGLLDTPNAGDDANVAVLAAGVGAPLSLVAAAVLVPPIVTSPTVSCSPLACWSSLSVVRRSSVDAVVRSTALSFPTLVARFACSERWC
jgi:hypothetical protein